MPRQVAHQIRLADNLTSVVEPVCNAERASKGAEVQHKKAVRQLERLYTDSRGKLDWMKTAKLLDSHLLGANKSTMVTASLAGTVSICAVGDSRALADFEKLYQRQ